MFAHINKCKFVDRKTGARQICPCTVTNKKHRRGYCSVACTVGHTWVWCQYCCDCVSEHGQLGCSNAVHWFERDSFDTGRRNHMQRHGSEFSGIVGQLISKRKIADTVSCENQVQAIHDHEEPLKKARVEFFADNGRNDCDLPQLRALELNSPLQGSTMDLNSRLCTLQPHDASFFTSHLRMFAPGGNLRLSQTDQINSAQQTLLNQFVFDAQLAKVPHPPQIISFSPDYGSPHPFT
jgi:hypothetical protein